MRRAIPLCLLAVVGLGAGPCEMLDALSAGADAGAGYCSEPCQDRLEVEILRSDNSAFWPGSYRFAAQLPDGGELSVECWLAHEESGLECELGDLDLLAPAVENGARRMWLVILGAPQSALVSIEYDGWIIGRREIVPAYEQVFPEGESCPSCLLAEESIAVEQW
ncbi:MAG: hypothetical protein R6V85_05585 [Polyangia bacterium]